MAGPVSLNRYLSEQFGIVLAIPVIVVAILLWLFMMPGLRSEAWLQHQSMARSIAGQVTAHLAGGERQLAALMNSIQTLGDVPSWQHSALFDAQCGDGALFETIYLADIQDMTISAVGLAASRRGDRDDLLGIDLSSRPFVRTIHELRGARWSETFLSTASGRMAVAASIALGDRFLTGEITLHRLSELISHIPVEADYTVLVIDQHGRIVADSRQMRAGQKLNTSSLPGDEDTSTAAYRFELDGESYFGSHVSTTDLGWTVLVAQPEAKIYKPVRNTLAMLAVGLGIALALALSIAWVQAGKLSRMFSVYSERAKSLAHSDYKLQWPVGRILEFNHLGQNLQEMADTIGQRERDLVASETRLSITLDSIGDAVIATDERGVVTRMNPMAETLTGWSSDEAVGQNLETVFRIVNSYTRNPVDSPVEEVLRRGVIVGLANHTVLIARDGTEFQIADSGAPIREEDDRIIGVVLVFRDVTEDYAKEQKILENEQRLRELTASVPGVVFQARVTADGEVISEFVNKHSADIFGLDNETENIIDAFVACIPEVDKSGYLESLKNAVRGVKPWTYEGQFRRPDGETIWFSANAVLRSVDDDIVLYGFLTDITERKKTELSLRLTQFIFDAASIGILRVSDDGHIMDANRQACADLGYTREELCGLGIPDINPDFTEAMWPEHHEKIAQARSMTIEVRHRHKNGRIFPASVFINLLEYDGETYHIAFVKDISERKKAEDELRKAQSYIVNIIESMPSMLIGVDRNGVVTQWNSRATSGSGVPESQAIGKPLGSVLPWFSTEMDRIDRAISTRVTLTSHKRVRIVDGANHYEDLTIFPLVADGVEGAVIRIDDVTERVKMEEVMIQSEKMLTVGGLAAGMAHEINNPLAGMLQTANVVVNRLTNVELPANLKAADAAGTNMQCINDYMQARGVPRMLDNINESGKRIADIVANMLSMARKDEPASSTCDLAELLDKTLQLASADYDLKKNYDFRAIEIVREYADDLPEIPCQRGKLQQVLLNILGNGAQAMQFGDTPSPRFILRTRLDEQNEMACIEIEDNGPGIEENTKKRIFEPFFTTKTEGVGTGLGLSVSYFIVTENHGGRLSVESQPGSGTRFTIALPIQRPAA